MEDYIIRLRQYEEKLIDRIADEKKQLEMLGRGGNSDWDSVAREPIARTIVAFQRALSNLYEFFPELKSER